MNSMNRLSVVFVFLISLCVTACSDDNTSSPAPATDTEDDGSLGGISGADADDDSNGGNKEGGAKFGHRDWRGGAEEGGAEEGETEEGGAEEGETEEGGGCEDGSCETADGTCVDEGMTDPGASCELCEEGSWVFNEGEACDDGSACTENDSCVEDACLGAPVICDSPGTCQVGTCDGEVGCVYAFEEGLACDDGNACTVGDVCAGLGCSVGEPADCDDGNSCTQDSCDPGVGCINEALENDAPCDDGNQCALGDFCAEGICAPGSEIVFCDDGDPCTLDKCVPAEGCTAPVQQTNACRPIINVTYPARAESVSVEDPTAAITVTGNVSSLAAPITALTLNGESVSFDVNGNFAVEMDATVGGNVLIFETENELGWTRKRVQAFHWSTGYILPSKLGDDIPEPECFGLQGDGGCWTAYFEESEVSWLEAEAVCVAGGGHLTSIHSVEENDAVRSLATETCGDTSGVWIGANDFDEEGTFAWSDGSAFDFVAWSADEPNDFNDNEDVGEMWADSSWNDAATDGTNSCYVCYVSKGDDADVEYGVLADPGLGVYLTQEALDDGDHSLPANDFATVLEAVFDAFDLNEVIPNPVAEGVEASGATYDIYVSNLTNDQPDVALTCIDGGFQVIATIYNVKGDFNAVKVDGGFFTPGDISGDLTLNSLVIETDVFLSVTEAHQLESAFENVVVEVDGINVDVDGLFGGLIGGALEDTLDGFASDMETLLVGEVPAVLGPVVGNTLAALAFSFDIELPSLNPEGAAVPVAVRTDFAYTDFAPGGGMLAFRAGAFPEAIITPYEVVGAPARVGCDGSGEALVVLGEAPLEVTLTDDTINTILLAAWQGGFLEFIAPASLFGDFDLSAFGITDLEATVSGMLPPSISNCNDAGEPLMTIGDIKLLASMNFSGEPLDLEIYASLVAEFNLSAANGEIGFGLGEISVVELELTALQDSQIGLEPLVAALLQEQALPGLLEGLQGDALGGIPLPSISLSDTNPDLALTIYPIDVVRVGGDNVVLATLNEGDAPEPVEEGGGEAPAEEGGGEAPVEEGGGEAPAEEGGGEAPVASGNCSNVSDADILDGYDAGQLTSIGTGCGTGCFFAGNQGQCIADCYQDELGVTGECASCFGESGACAISNCAGECAGGADSENCLNCVEDSGCTVNFTACAYGE